MNLIKLLLLISLVSATAYADEPPPVDPPCVKDDPRPQCLFTFDPDGKVHPKDPKAARIFNFPPIKAGFIFDVNHVNILPYTSLEVLDWDIGSEMFNSNIGVSWGRVLVDIQWVALPIISIGPTIWGGYNVGANDWAAGIGFGILKF
jgi:hypothetical protein